MNWLNKIYRKFSSGSLKDKALLLEALLLAMIVRFLMLFVKYKFYEKYLGKRGESSPDSVSENDLKHSIYITNKIKAISKYTPWESKCMVQSLTSKWMLNRRSIPSTIYFGVYRDPIEGLKAHSWLRVGPRILTGQEGLEKFNEVNRYS